MKYCINIDWLQVYVHDDNAGALNLLYSERSSYEFVRQPYSSRQFSEVWIVFNADGDEYCTIQRVPFSAIIDTRSAIIKLANRECYKRDCISTLVLFLTCHGFRYKSMSRLDVCHDSNTLYNGLKHSSLIKRIMSGEVLKNNQARVKWHFDSIANISRPMECNSCSFGSPSSGVSSKMYNKSLELAEVKNKPYIVESWKYNGLDIGRDVWRVELSIKSDMSHVIRSSTGEIFRLDPDVIASRALLEDIFFSYAAKYFSFKVNDGKANKTRMANLQLFSPSSNPTLHPTRITNETDSTRADRIFLKKLTGLRYELRNVDATTMVALAEVARAFSLNKSLTERQEYQDFIAWLKTQNDNQI